MGITGNIAPESLKTGKFTEKNDVFSFGTLLLELLTGQRGYDLSQDETALLLNCGDGGVDPTIPIEGEGILEQQVYKLFLRCSSLTAEERPTMVDVSKELRQILRLGSEDDLRSKSASGMSLPAHLQQQPWQRARRLPHWYLLAEKMRENRL
uniref:Protein kinase domain-containing protein n=1 Tax=Vitis vinifera TaxID=29760 RepID=F6H575_VITVI